MLQQRDGEGQGKWLVLLAAFLSFFLVEALLKSLGVLLQSVSQQLGTETWPIGFAVGMTVAARGFSGPFLKMLQGRWEHQQIAFVSGLVAALGVIAASQVQSALQYTLCLALLSGASYGLILNISLVLLGQHFQRMYACANGLACSGGALGILAATPLTQLLLDTYGWRGALLLLGGVQLHLAALGRLLKSGPSAACVGQERNNGYAIVARRDEDGDGEEAAGDGGFRSKSNTTVAGMMRAVGLDLFSDPAYVGLVWTLGVQCFTNVAWLAYTVPHLVVRGLSQTDVTLVVSAGALGVLLGQVGHGFLLDLGFLRGRTLLGCANLAAGLALMLDPLMARPWPLALSNVVLGLGVGLSVPLCFTMMREAVGVDRMSEAVGWAELMGGLLRLISSFLTGWWYDKIGNYTVSYIVLGTLPCCVFLTLLCGDIYSALKRRWSQ